MKKVLTLVSLLATGGGFPFNPAAAQSLTLSQRWVINGSDVDWSTVSWLSPRHDGSLALAQPMDGKFVVISSTGREGASIGRRGAGPGEFGNPQRGGWLGDTIWISDPRNSRLSYIMPGRGVLRELPIPTAVLRPQGGSGGDKLLSLGPTLLAPLPGGGLLLTVTPANVPQPAWVGKVDSASRIVVAVDAEGRLTRRITQVAANPCFAPVSVEGQPGSARIPFCQDPIIDASVDGRTTITLVHTFSGSAELAVTGSDGRVIARRTFAEPGSPITRAAQDSARAAVPVPGVADWVRSLRMPDRYPAWRGMVIGTDGTIWLEHGTPGPTREWHLFDQGLRPLGSVNIPRNVSIRAANRNALWGVREESDGLESLIRYDVGAARGR